MEEWVSIILNNGFAVAVAAFLLWRLEPAITKLNDSVNMLAAMQIRSADINDDELMKIYREMQG